MLCLNLVDFVVQPRSNDLAVSGNDTLKPSHLNGATLHNGPLEQKLSSLSIESSGYNWSSMLPFVCQFSATTLPSHVQQYPVGATGGVMPRQQEAAGVGRGYGRGRGRSLLTPVRQPNTRPPPPKVSMGRGIGSFTSGAKSNVVINHSTKYFVCDVSVGQVLKDPPTASLL